MATPRWRIVSGEWRMVCRKRRVVMTEWGGDGATGTIPPGISRRAIRHSPFATHRHQPCCAPRPSPLRGRTSPFRNPAMAQKQVRKVVLAYSGGLDTSIILKWLQTTYGCEVITFTADLGQGEELGAARRKAELLGIKQIFVEDLREEFIRDFVLPMFRANALYEGVYLLGTSIARPLIAKRLVEIARATGADAIAHGATGKGNDQV